MKLLLSAVACDPFGGSEGIYGWHVVSALAKEHDCFVITSGDNLPSLERANQLGMVPRNLKFRFIGQAKPCHANRLIARLESWLRFFFFLKRLLSLARSWHAEESFDLAQHITYTTWRFASPLRRLKIPFVWGPISGTEPFPASCLSTLSFSSFCFEILRSAQSWVALKSPAIRACARKAFCIPVPHRQAWQFLQRLRGHEEGIFICHNFFFTEERIQWLRACRHVTPPDRPLRAFAAGNLEGRKGIAIALHSLFLAKSAGVRVEYQVTSLGPEFHHLLKLVRKLGLEDQVKLGQRFDSADYPAALGSFDLCLLPSLRDGAGLSIMEAMLAGCVPIVADWCGPAEFVTPECGFKITVGTPKKMAQEIARILCELHKNRPRVLQKGMLARERIVSSYNERQFLECMNDVYRRAVARLPVPG